MALCKSQCSVCHKNINKNHLCLVCSSCKNNIHPKCNLLSITDYHKNHNNVLCINCIDQNIPFSKLTQNEFYLLLIRGLNSTLDIDEEINLDFLTQTQQNHFNKINDVLRQTTIDISNEENHHENDSHKL